MSGKTTAVSVEGHSGLLLWGHVGYTEALSQFRAHCQKQADEAAAKLAALDAGDVKVFHQRGIYRTTGVTEVMPPRARESTEAG